jgi:hypothetical protein
MRSRSSCPILWAFLADLGFPAPAAVLSGQYRHPLRVVAFNTAEGWARDVSADIARKVVTRGRGLDHELPAAVRDFVSGRVREKLGDGWLITNFAHLNVLVPQVHMYRKLLSEAEKDFPAEAPITRECHVGPTRAMAHEERRCNTSTELIRHGASTSSRRAPNPLSSHLRISPRIASLSATRRS